MPELPEVETIRNDLLCGGVVGRRIVRAEVLWPKLVQRPLFEEFIGRLSARDEVGETNRIEGIVRRGKYLALRLGPDGALVVHLGMTGRLLLRWQEDEPDTFLRARFVLDDGRELRFCDARKFGKLWLAEDETEVVSRLGPEPLDESFSVEELAGRLARRGSPIKAVLLDQAVLAGMGNIYVDEALFAARIHPFRLARSLTIEEVKRLYAAIRQVLALGIANCGTTFSDYRNAHGQPGRNQEVLQVYRLTGRPCSVCGVPIARTVLGGRGTHFCPACQGNPAES